MTNNQNTPKQNYNAIDLTKFIFAIIVIMAHIPPLGEPCEGSLSYNLYFWFRDCLGRVINPFFFISAGYFLFRKIPMNSSTDMNRAVKYITHVLKLYIIWTIIYFPAVLSVYLRSGRSPLRFIISYIRNFFIVGSYIHLWFLNSLIIAVCIIVFLLYKKVKPPIIIFMAICFYVIGLFAQTWFGFITPLKGSAPFLWKVLIMTKKTIVTTRNGLFCGFVFVTIGMLFAYYNINLTRRASLVLWLISTVGMFIEIYLVHNFHYAREYDMNLCMIPSGFFLFSFVKQISLPDNKIFKVFRSQSSIIYYVHFLIYWIFQEITKFLSIDASHSCLPFLFVLIGSCIISYAIYTLSKKEKWKFLNNLY